MYPNRIAVLLQRSGVGERRCAHLGIGGNKLNDFKTVVLESFAVRSVVEQCVSHRAIVPRLPPPL